MIASLHANAGRFAIPGNLSSHSFSDFPRRHQIDVVIHQRLTAKLHHAAVHENFKTRLGISRRRFGVADFVVPFFDDFALGVDEDDLRLKSFLRRYDNDTRHKTDPSVRNWYGRYARHWHPFFPDEQKQPNRTQAIKRWCGTAFFLHN